jgi:7,8-dihydroneopterin aldolase/epimerase/oxygenase
MKSRDQEDQPPDHRSIETARAKPAAQGRAGQRYTVVVRGLVVLCSIGIGRAERERPQRVRVSVELTATEAASVPGDNRRQIIDYRKVVAAIRDIAGSGHIDLCEGFAARICDACLADPRVGHIRVEVDKLDIYADAEAVGAILERDRPG